MPIIWTRGRLALLVATGMLLFLGGVVAGSAVGTLIRPEPESPAGRPMLLGQDNRAGERRTRLVSNTSGGALWSIQRGRGAAVLGEAPRGRGGVFSTGHRSASGAVAENTAGSQGSGEAFRAIGNSNVGVRASSESIALAAESGEIAVYADGAVIVAGELMLRGVCDGCSATVIATNESDRPIASGDAVTVTGSTTDGTGAILLQVEPAQQGGRAIGIAAGAVVRTGVALSLESEVVHYEAVDGSVPPGGMLRLVLSGIVAVATADLSGGEIRVGDSLVPGATPGTLIKGTPQAAGGVALGYALGTVQDGAVPMLISTH